jgi:hypothetical protein
MVGDSGVVAGEAAGRESMKYLSAWNNDRWASFHINCCPTQWLLSSAALISPTRTLIGELQVHAQEDC